MVSALSHEQAQRMSDAAMRAARSQGVAAVVSVVDAGGHLISLQRMDGAAFGAVRFSERKAMSSAALGAPTGMLAKAVTAMPGLASAMIDGIAFVDGGLPVRFGKQLVGGIGVAGGMGGQDEAIAQAGLAVFEKEHSLA